MLPTRLRGSRLRTSHRGREIIFPTLEQVRRWYRTFATPFSHCTSSLAPRNSSPHVQGTEISSAAVSKLTLTKRRAACETGATTTFTSSVHTGCVDGAARTTIVRRTLRRRRRQGGHWDGSWPRPARGKRGQPSLSVERSSLRLVLIESHVLHLNCFFVAPVALKLACCSVFRSNKPLKMAIGNPRTKHVIRSLARAALQPVLGAGDSNIQAQHDMI